MQTHRTWRPVHAGAVAVRAAAVLVAAAAVMLLAPGTGRAQTSFAAQASATAVQLTVANRELPLVSSVEAGGPTAGASLSSNGQGAAFAANPDPGETAAELPATAAGLTGLPVPSYPFYVATTTGDDPVSWEKPGQSLVASCAARRGRPTCAGSAAAGAEPVVGSATARVTEPSDDEVRAVAEAASPALVVPGAVSLSSARSSATVVLRGGTLQRTSSLTVSGLAAAGSPAFDITDGVVRLAGTAAPVPFATLVDALRTVGVEAQLFAARQSPDGVVAPVLRLTTSLPGAPVGITGPSQLVLEVGGADAFVRTGGSWGDAARGSDQGDEPAGTTSSGGSASGTSVPDIGPLAGPALPAASAAADARAAAPALAAAPRAVAPRSFRLAETYLALVVSAVAWLAVTHSARVMGVRLLWRH